MTQHDIPQDAVIASLFPSKIRFGIGLVGIATLGIFLLWVGLFSEVASSLGRLMFLVLGAATSFLAFKIYNNQLHGILLTEDGLFDTTGAPLCTMNQIASVDRSFFAFRPSNGFSIQLNEPMPRAWFPGLWWRFGRRIGVGGLTAQGSGRAMADILTLRIKGISDDIFSQ